MAERVGRVISVDGDRACVAFKPRAGCRSCAAGFGCGIGPVLALFGRRRPSQLEVRVPRSGSLKVGDRVKVGISATELLRAAAIAYLLPLLSTLSGSVLAWLVVPAAGDAGTVTGGLIGMTAACMLMALAARQPLAVTADCGAACPG
jgi:sigma-E factor negative regulatory protein RseC